MNDVLHEFLNDVLNLNEFRNDPLSRTSRVPFVLFWANARVAQALAQALALLAHPISNRDHWPSPLPFCESP